MTRPDLIRPDQTVLIDGDRIVAIGPRDAVPVPEDVMLIDGTDKYLMPGLADMHVHLEYFDEPTVLDLFLANGVTTVRNMDGRDYLLEWRDQVSAGELVGPTIVTAGPLLDGDPPLRADNTVVTTADDARAAVTEQAQLGYDFVKVYTNLSADAYAAILDAADEHGLPVVGHVPRFVSIDEALASGQHAIEHLTDYADLVESDDSPFREGFHWSKLYFAMPADAEKFARAARQIAAAGVWSTPTAVQADRAIAPPAAIDDWLASPSMAYVGAAALEF